MAVQRAAVVAEARSWRGTPYFPCADIKGAGVDCGMLLVRVFVDLGLVEPFEPRPYAPDWNMHRDEERFLEVAERIASRRLPDGAAPDPGDVVIWRHGRTFSHGGIVTAWPRVVHAYARSQTTEESNAELDSHLTALKGGQPRPRRFYSLWPAA